MKREKAVERDGLIADMMEAFKDVGVESITNVLNKIYQMDTPQMI